MTRTIDPAVYYEGRELAEMLGISVKTMQRAGLVGSRISARRTLYLGRDVIAWIDKRKLKRAG